MEKKKKIRGKITSGVGKGAYFTTLSWVQQQCFEKLGFKPFPGTLNLEIEDAEILIVDAFHPDEGIKLVPPDSNFCSGYAYPVSISGIPGAIISPAAEVRTHAKNIIEIISGVSLKDSLAVKDGDLITLEIETFTKPSS